MNLKALACCVADKICCGLFSAGECAICLETFSHELSSEAHPRVLTACGHSFCARDLKQLLKDSKIK